MNAITSDIPAAAEIESPKSGHWLVRAYIASAISFGAMCVGILVHAR